MKYIFYIIGIACLVFSSHAVFCQEYKINPGVYTSYEQMPQKDSLSIIPQIYVSINDIYIEARYNYEDPKTPSFYVGKIFPFGKNKQYKLTAMIGSVFDKVNGISFATYFSIDTLNIKLETENQFVVYPASPSANFFYDWSQLYYRFHVFKTNIGLGGGCQFTSPFNDELHAMAGPMIRWEITKQLALEGYAHSFWDKRNQMFVLGLDLEL